MLRLSEDQEVKTLLNQIHRGVNVKEAKSEYDLHRRNKVRLIDPSVLYENKLISASKLSEDVKRMNEKAKEKAENGMYVKIISNL
ncbi:hypothetical protein J2TS4_38600 [Paenibacillus sp. J2TS4]|nr:hypothetical protein J2TS4_38600 [Paenibacillus sp. J2TS4]